MKPSCVRFDGRQGGIFPPGRRSESFSKTCVASRVLPSCAAAKASCRTSTTGGKGVATMCPICMATLEKASNEELENNDISEFLMKAFCEESVKQKRSPKRNENAENKHSEP